LPAGRRTTPAGAIRSGIIRGSAMQVVDPRDMKEAIAAHARPAGAFQTAA